MSGGAPLLKAKPELSALTCLPCITAASGAATWGPRHRGAETMRPLWRCPCHRHSSGYGLATNCTHPRGAELRIMTRAARPCNRGQSHGAGVAFGRGRQRPAPTQPAWFGATIPAGALVTCHHYSFHASPSCLAYQYHFGRREPGEHWSSISMHARAQLLPTGFCWFDHPRDIVTGGGTPVRELRTGRWRQRTNSVHQTR
jgi:hypothetical protein